MYAEEAFVTTFFGGLILLLVLVCLSANETNEVTDGRGCKIIEHRDNRVFGQDTKTVNTYCPEP